MPAEAVDVTDGPMLEMEHDDDDDEPCSPSRRSTPQSTTPTGASHPSKPTRSILSETSANKNSKTRKKLEVSFGTITVREYSMTLSEHPSCSYGPPVQLDWDYDERDQLQVDDFEDTRGRRRSMRQLVLNYYRRCDILKGAGFTDGDIKKAERAVNKAKRQRETTKFFSPVNRVAEVVQSAGGKIKKRGGGRKSKQ